MSHLTPEQREVWERSIRVQRGEEAPLPITAERIEEGKQIIAALAQERALRIAKEQAEEKRLKAEQRARKRQEDAAQRIRDKRPQPPAPQLFGVSHLGAEAYVADWMRHLGIIDAKVTRASNDGGIDVESRHVVAQVKNYTRLKVPISEIRDLAGVAKDQGKHAVMFTSSGVSEEGRRFADRNRIALLRYDAVAGTMEGLNALGERAYSTGFPEAYGYSE